MKISKNGNYILRKIFKVRILIQKDFQPIVTSELCIFIERQFKPVHTIVLLPSMLYIVYTSSCWHQLRFSRLWPARIFTRYHFCHVTYHLKISSKKWSWPTNGRTGLVILSNTYNVCFIKIRTTHSSVLLMCVVRFFMKQTLPRINSSWCDLHVVCMHVSLKVFYIAGKLILFYIIY